MTVGNAFSTAGRAVAVTGNGTFAYDNASGSFNVGNSTLTLGGTNAITAANLRVPNINGTGALWLGQTNTLFVNTFFLASHGEQANRTGTVRFDAALTNPTVFIRAANGTDRANVRLASDQSVVWNANNTATMDFSGGTVDARFGTVRMGWGRTGDEWGNSHTATLTFDAGVIDLTDLSLGICPDKPNGTQRNNVTATVNVNGSGTLIADTVRIGRQYEGDFASGRVTGRLNIGGGTVEATTIQIGENNGGEAIRQINFSSGTLANKAGTDLTIGSGIAIALLTAAEHYVVVESERTAGVNSAITGAAGTGGLTKQGGGALRLNAANTFTGAVTVEAGALGGTGSLAAAVTVGNGAALAPGDGTGGTLTVNNDVTLSAGSTLLVDLSSESHGKLVVNGDLTVAGHASPTPTVGYTPSSVSQWVIATATGEIDIEHLTVVDNNYRVKRVGNEVHLYIPRGSLFMLR